MTEWLWLALACQQGLLDELPVPTLAETDGKSDDPDDERAQRARRIQDAIIERLKKKKPFDDLLLDGWMYQWVNHCSQVNPSFPTVTQFAEFMGLSRQAFYRKYPNAKEAIARAFERAGGKIDNAPPASEGLDLAQSANMDAKKTNYIGDSEPDPYAEDQDD